MHYSKIHKGLYARQEDDGDEESRMYSRKSIALEHCHYSAGSEAAGIGLVYNHYNCLTYQYNI